MIETPLCALLCIEHPVLQGGMAWISDASLASAVSNAGGLGILSAMSMNAAQLREQIRQTRMRTSKPFGVNIMLMSPHVEEAARCVVEEKVPVVTTGAGLPGKYMSAWLEAGIRVLPVVPSVAVARRVWRSGASAVIAEGGESGGHVGDLTTMTLVPQVCDAVDIPVIAAGGIGDGRGMAAALMLGAVGIQMGTRFLAARECTVHRVYKEKVLAARDIDTMTTGRRLGHPVRALKNAFTNEFLRREYDSEVSNEALEQFGAGALRRAAKAGDDKEGCFMMGQAAAFVKREQTAGEIIEDILSDTERILRGANQWIK